MKNSKSFSMYGEEASFRCSCGATMLTTRNNELKRAAIHMQCRTCNCYLKRVTGCSVAHAVSVGG